MKTSIIQEGNIYALIRRAGAFSIVLKSQAHNPLAVVQRSGGKEILREWLEENDQRTLVSDCLTTCNAA